MAAFSALSDTFDTTNALSGMYLWIIFGYLSALLNCDLQRMIKGQPIVLHAFGLTAFFFLFTVLDGSNKTAIGYVWLKTVFIYILFILMTKSKWYFVVPVLLLLLVDQTLKKDVAFHKAGEESSSKHIEKYERVQQLISRVINIGIIFIILIGTLHYFFLQRAQHGTDFSFFKFFLGWTRCHE
jgi:hypothetical protein